MLEVQLHFTIDCYNCGEPVIVDYRPDAPGPAYGYCAACDEGVKVEGDLADLLIFRA